MPQSDGPYKIVAAFPERSEYTLRLPNDKRHTFSRFHASLLKRHVANNRMLFPNREYTHPSPVIMEDGATDHQVIDKIIDEHRHGRGRQYLMHWVTFPPEHDEWLPHLELDDCEALDVWEAWKLVAR
ncbi:hypothetical protein J132_01290 [Termitomyces sp. J132]|nr:hypothetical protein J132_01290 [Termitomyces sp. J132]